jgi:hypothetical protein
MITKFWELREAYLGFQIGSKLLSNYLVIKLHKPKILLTYNLHFVIIFVYVMKMKKVLIFSGLGSTQLTKIVLRKDLDGLQK